MLELAKSTWTEVHAFLTEQTVAILPVGNTAPHGPHLPLDTDSTIAVAQARRAAELLEERGYGVLLLPAVPYGVTQWTDGFAGTLCLQPGTLWSILDDLIQSLAEHGVKQIVFSNGNMELEHLNVLRGVILDHGVRGFEKAHAIFPDPADARWAASLGEEFAGGDSHGGRFETGILMDLEPETVRPFGGLTPVHVGLIEKVRGGARNFRQCEVEDAYCGDPASASAAEGSKAIESLAQILVTCVTETWPEIAE